MPSTNQTQHTPGPVVKHSYGVPLHATHITASVNGVETDVPIHLIAAAPGMAQFIRALATGEYAPDLAISRARALLEEIK